ncbi:MAG: hypothetical protein NUW37_13205 [Planctomycetes bacterium]|nr:hypothetical protein [Planctomycetota bacterium]
MKRKRVPFGVIVRKDITISGRSKHGALRRFVIGSLIFAATFFVLSRTSVIAEARSSYTIPIQVYENLVFVLIGLAMLVVPLQMASTIIIDVESGNLEMLFLTSIRRKRIFIEKFIGGLWRSVEMMLLSIPFLVLMSLLSAAPIFRVIFEIVLLFTLTLAIGSISFYFAAKHRDIFRAGVYTWISFVSVLIALHVVLPLFSPLIDFFFRGHLNSAMIIDWLKIVDPFSVYSNLTKIEGWNYALTIIFAILMQVAVFIVMARQSGKYFDIELSEILAKRRKTGNGNINPCYSP